MCVLVAGCSTVTMREPSAEVKAPPLPSEAVARLALVRKGMRRADVEKLLGPPSNSIAVSTSGLSSDYYSLTPEVRVRVDFMLQNVSPPGFSEHDIVVRKPDTLSVKTVGEGKTGIRWVNVPAPHEE